MILSLNNAPDLTEVQFRDCSILAGLRRLVNLVGFVLSRCVRYKCIEIESE